MFTTRLLSQWTRASNTGASDYESLLPLFPQAGNISPHIYQICLRGNAAGAREILSSLPGDFLQNIERLRGLNSGWDYTLICDKEALDFIPKYYGPSVLSYYNRIDRRYGAARADFLRYLVLYAKGGVYLDLKSTISRPLTDSLEGTGSRMCVFYWDNLPQGKRHCLIPDSAPDGEYLNGFLACPSGHPGMRAVILELMKRIDSYDPHAVGVGWNGVQLVTGPTMYTSVICRLREKWGDDGLRLAKPFSDFGYQLSFQDSSYSPGEYQKKTGMRDYRTCVLPVVKSCNVFVQSVNLLYLRLQRCLLDLKKI